MSSSNLLGDYGMANQGTTAPTASPTVRSVYVYGMALTCLVAGLAIGYLLRGSQSPASPEQAAANSAATSSGSAASVGQIPGAEKVILERAGHAANIDQPAAFNAAVRAFLDRVTA